MDNKKTKGNNPKVARVIEEGRAMLGDDIKITVNSFPARVAVLMDSPKGHLGVRFQRTTKGLKEYDRNSFDRTVQTPD